jgi:membrane associated rhomboid family serine protease
MRNVKGIQSVDASKDGAVIPGLLCPNATTSTSFCPLHVVCGFGGDVPDPKFNGDINQSPEPNQWYRFILSIFMHAGLIHIIFNLLLQLTIAKEMEMAIGSIRFLLVYMSAETTRRLGSHLLVLLALSSVSLLWFSSIFFTLGRTDATQSRTCSSSFSIW